MFLYFPGCKKFLENWDRQFFLLVRFFFLVYLNIYKVSMAFVYIQPSIFVIGSTFRTFFDELHYVWVPWLGTNRPHEEVNFTFRVSEHVLPTNDVKKKISKFASNCIQTINKVVLKIIVDYTLPRLYFRCWRYVASLNKNGVVRFNWWTRIDSYRCWCLQCRSICEINS